MSCADAAGPCTKSYDYGTVVTLTATPTAGYTFTGWSTDCTGTGNCVVTMDGAKTVKATFAIKTYLVTASAPTGGSIASGEGSPLVSCGATCSATVDHGTSMTFAATPTTEIGRAHV